MLIKDEDEEELWDEDRLEEKFFMQSHILLSCIDAPWSFHRS